MNSRLEGLAETQAAAKFFGISLSSPSPANKRVRLAYRLAMAHRKQFPNNYTRQQARANRLKAWRENRLARSVQS